MRMTADVPDPTIATADRIRLRLAGMDPYAVAVNGPLMRLREQLLGELEIVTKGTKTNGTDRPRQ